MTVLLFAVIFPRSIIPNDIVYHFVQKPDKWDAICGPCEPFSGCCCVKPYNYMEVTSKYTQTFVLKTGVFLEHPRYQKSPYALVGAAASRAAEPPLCRKDAE